MGVDPPRWHTKLSKKSLDAVLGNAVRICDEAEERQDERAEGWATVRDALCEARDEIVNLRRALTKRGSDHERNPDGSSGGSSEDGGDTEAPHPEAG